MATGLMHLSGVAQLSTPSPRARLDWVYKQDQNKMMLLELSQHSLSCVATTCGSAHPAHSCHGRIEKAAEARSSLRALRENSLTSKLVRTSPKRHTNPVVRHAPSGVNSPPPALHFLAHSNSPAKRNLVITAWYTIVHGEWKTSMEPPGKRHWKVGEKDVDNLSS
eukprot:1142304-Pelagomonas_calceolata.AAC.3